MRYVLKDFGSIGKFMTGLSRQFGPVEHYIRFVRSAALADAEPAQPEGRAGPWCCARASRRRRGAAGDGTG